MSKTQHNSEKSSNKNGNKPERNDFPPDWIVEDTLNGDESRRTKKRSNLTTRHDRNRTSLWIRDAPELSFADEGAITLALSKA